MSFLNLVRQRYSVRSFSSKKVEQEKIDSILEAGRLSPTACNKQPQRILVLDSVESLNKLKECTPYHFDAALAFLICYDENSSWVRRYDNQNEGKIDACIVTTQMMLEITEVGLGTTWVGSFDPQKVKEKFELPDGFVPVAILPVGYPSIDANPSAMHDSRLELGKTVFYNSFN